MRIPALFMCTRLGIREHRPLLPFMELFVRLALARIYMCSSHLTAASSASALLKKMQFACVEDKFMTLMPSLAKAVV
jgi:hypothetical protein